MREEKLSRLLVETGLLGEAQLRKAVDLQNLLGGKLGAIVVKLGFISDEDLTKFLAKQENLQTTDLSDIVIPEDLIHSLPRDVLERHQMVPVQSKNGILTLAMSDPTDFEAIEKIQFLTDCRIEITMAPRAQVARVLNELFYGEGDWRASLDDPSTEGEEGEFPKGVELEPGFQKALIALLVEKGVITLEELREKADFFRGRRARE